MKMSIVLNETEYLVRRTTWAEGEAHAVGSIELRAREWDAEQGRGRIRTRRKRWKLKERINSVTTEG